jgi:hypothetical protein
MTEPKKRGRPSKPKELPAETVEQAGEQIAKTKRKGNNPKADFMQENVKKGDNARYLRMARAAVALPPIDIADPEQVSNRIGMYFDFCEQNDRKPSMLGIANWIGVSRDTLNSWKRGEYRATTHSDLIEKAVMVLEELWTDYMQNGLVNPVSGIFLGKVMFGYKDVQDYVITPNQPLGQDGDPATMAQKYKQALPEATIIGVKEDE